MRVVLHRPRVRPDHHVRVDVHRRTLPAQSHHGNGLPAGHVPQTVPGARLGHPGDTDGYLGRLHVNAPADVGVSSPSFSHFSRFVCISIRFYSCRAAGQCLIQR